MGRKRLKQLTNEDFNRFPIWEFSRGNKMEENIMVIPFDIGKQTQLQNRLSSAVVFDTFYAKTKFTSNNGRIFQGYCRITNHTSEFLIQPYSPVIITEDSHIPLWYGMQLPSKEVFEEHYMTLRINPNDLFPLQVKVIPNIFHIENKGVIPGFSGVDEKMKDVVITHP